MINFHFGKPSKKTIATYSIIISSIIAVLTQCTGVQENKLWDLLDEIQRKYFPQTPINKVIIEDPEKLNRRVERDVDKAIQDVMPEYDRIIREADSIYKPRYIEEENDDSLCYTDECKSLGPPMRICAPWLDSCPKN